MNKILFCKAWKVFEQHKNLPVPTIQQIMTTHDLSTKDINNFFVAHKEATLALQLYKEEQARYYCETGWFLFGEAPDETH